MCRKEKNKWKIIFHDCQSREEKNLKNFLPSLSRIVFFCCTNYVYTRSSSLSIEMPQHCLPSTLLRRMELRSRWRFTMAVFRLRCRVNISIYCCSLLKKEEEKHLTNTKQTLHTKSLLWGWGNTNKQIFSQSEEKEEMEKLGKLVELRATLLCRIYSPREEEGRARWIMFFWCNFHCA